MNKSIGLKVALFFVMFSLAIIGLIGLAVRFVLPSYYTNQQLSRIEAVSEQIHQTYDENDPEALVPLLDTLRNDVGGELYYYTALGVQKGYGSGKGRNAVSQSNSEKFLPSGNVTDYTYTNKVGLEIYALGIAIGDEYLVYEVSIQTLDDAVGIILQFFWILLILVLVIAILVSIVLSRNIAKPVRALNKLAQDMKSKKVEAIMVTDSQDEIGQLNQSLNELYEELLSSIYQLERELKKERNAENLKKRFLAQATHELKTPISVIRGYAEILYDGIYKDEEDRDRYLKNIYDESEAISHLILDVLDYTRMETGNHTLDLSNVKAKEFYSDLAERYRGFIESKELQANISVNLPSDLKQSLDTNRLEQVFRNLISNAAEHGHHQVTIKVDQLGHKVRIVVANDGPAINEEDIPYLFDSFYKKKGKQKGSGLGLAIVKEIVLLHGGDYRAENTENGVKFVVVI